MERRLRKLRIPLLAVLVAVVATISGCSNGSSKLDAVFAERAGVCNLVDTATKSELAGGGNDLINVGSHMVADLKDMKMCQFTGNSSGSIVVDRSRGAESNFNQSRKGLVRVNGDPRMYYGPTIVVSLLTIDGTKVHVEIKSGATDAVTLIAAMNTVIARLGG